jgi:adenylate kinase
VKEKGLHAGRDAKFDSYLIDEASEDRIVDELEPVLGAAGGVLLEHHTSAFFPERWFDLVLVLRTGNTLLFDRLVKRGYSVDKVQENVTAEIMQVVLDEATECYPAALVHELRSDSVEDVEGNVGRVVAWLEAWRRDNAGKGAAAAAAAAGAGGADGR